MHTYLLTKYHSHIVSKSKERYRSIIRRPTGWDKNGPCTFNSL